MLGQCALVSCEPFPPDTDSDLDYLGCLPINLKKKRKKKDKLVSMNAITSTATTNTTNKVFFFQFCNVLQYG